MYGLPGQTVEQLDDSISFALACQPKHLSLYSLTVEPGSVFGKNGVKQIDEDLEADMYEQICRTLERNGFMHYEVSNFALPGYESVHNTNVWHYDDFYGIGYGAWGKDSGGRYEHAASLKEYCRDPLYRNYTRLSKSEQMFEMLMMARYAHKKIFDRDSRDDEEVCDRALAIVGLSDTKRRSFLSLSGGEKQRIYLAMAFAQESELILLDEPTNHLDIGYQLSMMEVLRSFREKTVFTSVHDMNLAAWYCDRLLLLNHGKIIRVGTPEEVLTPELIRNVFHVNAAVNRRPEDGRIQISYLSYIRS